MMLHSSLHGMLLPFLTPLSCHFSLASIQDFLVMKCETYAIFQSLYVLRILHMFTNLNKRKQCYSQKRLTGPFFYFPRAIFFFSDGSSTKHPPMACWNVPWCLCTVICTCTKYHVIAAHIVLEKMHMLLSPSITFDPALSYGLCTHTMNLFSVLFTTHKINTELPLTPYLCHYSI